MAVALHLIIMLWIFSFVPEVTGIEQLKRIHKKDDFTSYCKTYGNYHFETYDNTFYDFPSSCWYKLTHDEKLYFNIEIHRPSPKEYETHSNPVYFTAVINSVIIKVNEEGVTINDVEFFEDRKVNDIEIKDSCDVLEIIGNGITVSWNWDDCITVALDDRFKGTTRGMCGDFDGDRSNDIHFNGDRVSVIMFGNIYKCDHISNKDCPDLIDNSDEHIEKEEDHKCKKQRKQCVDIMSRMGDCQYKLSTYKDFLKTCTADLCSCTSEDQTSCPCQTLNQFSKDCVQAKGSPGQWRSPNLCFHPCPKTMKFNECALCRPNTCSDPSASKVCTDKCVEKCDCPPGTVWDDVSHHKECIEQKFCPCVHKEKVYKPGDSYTAGCLQCFCIMGQWTCSQIPCFGNCTLKGGSRMHTYDDKEYTFHGNCLYLLSKDKDNRFSVSAKINQCGVTEAVTCLNAVYVYVGKLKIKVCYCGNVHIGSSVATLPVTKGNTTIFRRAGFYVNVVTDFGLSVEIKVKPLFEVTVSLCSTFQNQTTGLCGNFNGIEADDWKTLSGIVENTAADFANSFKNGASCPDIPRVLDDPCINSIEKGKYAKEWCPVLLDKEGIFAACHSELDPISYFKCCKHDVCNLDTPEEALCARLEDYANDCRNLNVSLPNWRNNICDPKCPGNLVFSLNPRYCNFSCSSLAERDCLCNFRTTTKEGCTCPEGTYLAEEDNCVPPDQCPCSYSGKSVPAHQTYKVDDLVCKCIRGILECPKKIEPQKTCNPPMYFYDCKSENPNLLGSQCQKSCTTQDLECYNKECEPGCVCPPGLVSDNKGDCIPPSHCPCMKGGKSYKQGETINDVCNTCTCKNSSWVCTEKHCLKTCTVYGNGHTITFDEAKGTIDSNHNHILFQDYCQNNTGSIQVILENNLCSGSNTICSLKLRIILLKTIIEISENTVACMDRHDHQQKDNSYRIETIGQNIIFKTSNLTVTYDRKLTVNVDLQPPTEGYVCGLCGDNDGYANNDLISSWSQHQTYASGVRSATEPCHDKPEKLAWAEKHCDIIKSEVFATCHSLVEPQDFYDTCIADTCSCGDDIGDCECLCASVAAYSAECGKHDICIKWRTPEICPIFCDYYNKDGHCDWHYKPCGSPCLPTCYNPNGNCDSEAREYEGCFPECSKERPIFDAENEMCIPLLNCTTCNEAEKLCDNKTGECLCCYNGQTYRKGDSITAYVNGKICPVGYCMDDGMLALMSTDCLFTPATTPVTITEFLTEILPTGISLESKTTETSSRSTFYTALLKSLSTPSSYSALHSTAKPTNGTNVISASVSSSTKEGFSITRKVTESELTSHISSTTPKLTSSIIPFTLSPTTVPRTIHKEFSSSLPSLITTTYTPTLTPATTLTYPDTFSVSRTVMISSPSPSETTETTSKATIESRTTNIYVTGSFLKMVTTPTTFTPTTHFYSDTIPVSKTIPLSSSTSIKTMHISTLTTLRSSTQLTTTPTLNNTMFSIYTGLSKITKATKPSSTAAEMQTGYSQSVSLTKSKTTYPSTDQSSSESPPTFNDSDFTTKKDECKLEAQNVNITKGECSASKTLTVNYCLGHCTTYSEFSFKTQRMVRTCSCCKETKITPRTIQLDCQNGKTEPYTYDHIEECVCEPVTCQG